MFGVKSSHFLKSLNCFGALGFLKEQKKVSINYLNYFKMCSSHH